MKPLVFGFAVVTASTASSTNATTTTTTDVTTTNATTNTTNAITADATNDSEYTTMIRVGSRVDQFEFFLR